MNQRPIKFRVWDGIMRYHLPVTVYEDGSWRLASYPSPENSVLMQSTGIHDKNGKEIWEGDIVDRTINHNAILLFEDFHVNYIVKWHSPYASFILEREDETFTFGGYLDTNEDLSKLKVIGNIYENPELMETNTR